MKTVVSLFVWFACAGIATAAERYTLDAAHSEMSFAVRNFASTVIGKFTDFSGTVEFNRQQPERSSAEATIQVRSIETGIKDRDHHLLSADFFDAQKFPTIHFKSTSVERTGERMANMYGDLTMHGSTLPILLHVELLPDEKSNSSTLRWRITADLKRSKFGLKWNPLIEASQAVGDDISIRMKIVTPSAASAR
jgi:polyisoprenoid-binding protein YceI